MGLGSLTGLLQGGIGNIVNMGSNMLNKILPPQTREDMKERLMKFATEKPYLASFLLSQIALSGLPMALFVIMTISVAIFALIAGLLVGLLGAVLFILAAVGFALIILLPTLFFTTFAAVAIWLWGMGAYFIVKRFNKKDVPGVHVPMADGIKKATGLGELNPNLTQNLAPKPQANGTAEKQSSKAHAESKPSAAKKRNNNTEAPLENATSEVGNAVGGAGKTVGVGL